MHYYILVFTEIKPTKDHIDNILAPYYEDEWDWYQKGGRWTGVLDGYNPEKDETLLEVCNLCDGTGTRTDMKVENGCNGCLGKGNRIPWPTEWPERDGDSQRVKDVDWKDPDKIPYAFIAKELLWMKKNLWTGKSHIENPDFKVAWVEALEKFKDGWATVVDCHN